jgi:hypothetical protein
MSRILRSRYKRALRPALVLVLLLVTAPAAQAVLLDGLDGSVNVSPFPDPVLDHVGLRAGLSAVYLGNGIVVTANHVGAGSVTFGGTVCDYVPNTAVRLTNVDGSLADLLMFEVYPRPDLDPLELTLVTPLFGSLLCGGGRLRSRAALVWDPNGTYAPGPTGGYAWGRATPALGLQQLRGVSGRRQDLQHPGARQLLRREAACCPRRRRCTAIRAAPCSRCRCRRAGSSPA